MISLTRKRGSSTAHWWTTVVLVGVGALAGVWMRSALPHRTTDAAFGFGLLVTLSLLIGWSNAASI